MECYLSLEKTKIMKWIGKWMDYQTTILSDITPTWKDKCHMLSHFQFLVLNL